MTGQTFEGSSYIYWWENGGYHREGGLPAVIYKDGSKEWWENDKLHRIDGPAIYDPVLEVCGKDYTWYVRGFVCKTAKEYQAATGRTDEEMLALILKYGPIR